MTVPAGPGRIKTIKTQCPWLEDVRLNKVVNKKSEIRELLLQYDERSVQMKYKFGILYGKGGQNTENEMFHNGISYFYLFICCLFLCLLNSLIYYY